MFVSLLSHFFFCSEIKSAIYFSINCCEIKINSWFDNGEKKIAKRMTEWTKKIRMYRRTFEKLFFVFSADAVLCMPLWTEAEIVLFFVGCFFLFSKLCDKLCWFFLYVSMIDAIFKFNSKEKITNQIEKNSFCVSAWFLIYFFSFLFGFSLMRYWVFVANILYIFDWIVNCRESSCLLVDTYSISFNKQHRLSVWLNWTKLNQIQPNWVYQEHFWRRKWGIVRFFDKERSTNIWKFSLCIPKTN